MPEEKPEDVAAGSAQRELETAIDLHRRGDREAAAKIYERLLGADPNHVDAIHLLGAIALEKQDLATAIDLISRSLNLENRNPSAHLNLGLALLATHDFDAALGSFDRSLSFDEANAGAWAGRADALAQLGRDDLAINGYERALMLDLTHWHAWRGYGMTLYRTGRHTEAIACFDRLLIKIPDDIAVLCAKGNALSQTGKTDEALACFDQVITLRPDHAHAVHQRGALQLTRGLLQEALTSFDTALSLMPTMSEAWQNRGNALARLRRLQEAMDSFTEVLRLKPDMHDALRNRGSVRAMIGDNDGALKDFDDALSFMATDVQTHVERAALLVTLKRHDEALDEFEDLLNDNPENADALLGKGKVFRALRRFDEALLVTNNVLTREPLHEEGMYEKAAILHDAHRFDEALKCAVEATHHHPDNSAVLNMHSLVLQALGRAKEAAEMVERAITIDPEYVDARFNAGLLYLRLGDYAKGWANFEFRWRLEKANGRRHNEVPEWSGSQDIAQKRLLVWADEGLGDTLQFSRYTRMLTTQGAKVVLEVQPPLKTLLTASLGDVTVVSRSEPVPVCDLAIPLLSLPFALRLDRTSIPYATDYIHANPELTERWRARFRPDNAGKPRIGIAVSGNPSHGNDRHRSASLRDFEPLLAIGDLYIVQRGLKPSDEEYLANHPAFENIGATFNDFDDAAAFVQNLDLVISVDTATVHLAAALGKPTWLLLPVNGDWRWGEQSESTDWYPTMRVFRQMRAGDWSVPIDSMVEHLKTGRI